MPVNLYYTQRIRGFQQESVKYNVIALGHFHHLRLLFLNELLKDGGKFYFPVTGKHSGMFDKGGDQYRVARGSSIHHTIFPFRQ